ncbi:MAG: hypothetical protein LBH41_01780 [Rickettsiales bacterium]|jgi:hypothetical protein|nr:hypothetical protein [Rickettsiales bacterium]
MKGLYKEYQEYLKGQPSDGRFKTWAEYKQVVLDEMDAEAEQARLRARAAADAARKEREVKSEAVDKRLEQEKELAAARLAEKEKARAEKYAAGVKRRAEIERKKQENKTRVNTALDRKSTIFYNKDDIGYYIVAAFLRPGKSGFVPVRMPATSPKYANMVLELKLPLMIKFYIDPNQGFYDPTGAAIVKTLNTEDKVITSSMPASVARGLVESGQLSAKTHTSGDRSIEVWHKRDPLLPAQPMSRKAAEELLNPQSSAQPANQDLEWSRSAEDFLDPQSDEPPANQEIDKVAVVIPIVFKLAVKGNKSAGR